MGVPALPWLHGHGLSPAVPSACCSSPVHLWVHPFVVHYHKKRLYKLRGQSLCPALFYSSHETVKTVLVSSNIASVF